VFSVFARTRAALVQLSPSVWRILLHSLLFGLAVSVSDLLFNFYLVSLGYASDVAGLMSTVSRTAGAVLGLPIGVLIDRAGPRRALLAGLGVYATGWVLLLFVRALWALIVAQFIVGAALILSLTAVVPLLTLTTTPGQRAAVFGMNASAALVIGLLGSASGGVLPMLAAAILGVGPQDTAAYRLALTVVVVISLTAALPLLRGIQPIADRDSTTADDVEPARLPALTLFRYAFPALLLGIGGGLILPFQNLFFRQQFTLGDAAVGVVLAGASLSMGIGGLLGAPVSSRFGLRYAAAWLRMVAGPAMLLMLAPYLLPAAIGFFLRGMCIAASYPLNDALIMLSTPPRQRGVAISLTSILWSLGWAAASVVSGWAQLRWGFTPVLVGAAIAYMLSAIAILLSGAGRPAVTERSEAMKIVDSR
jgi:MFS family permease